MPEPQEPLLVEFVPKADPMFAEMFWRGVAIGFCLAVLMMMGAGLLLFP